jgi:hypothetical protein
MTAMDEIRDDESKKALKADMRSLQRHMMRVARIMQKNARKAMREHGDELEGASRIVGMWVPEL